MAYTSAVHLWTVNTVDVTCGIYGYAVFCLCMDFFLFGRAPFGDLFCTSHYDKIVYFMKNLYLYKIPIVYMLLYTVAILLSGVWLFLLSQGSGEKGIGTTLHTIIYMPVSKSIYGLMEVATPHLVSMGMLIFLATHFLLFSTKVSKAFSKKVSILLFIVAFANIFSYFLISFGLLTSGWVKLLLMSVFVSLFVFVLLLVAISLFSNHSKETSPSKFP